MSFQDKPKQLHMCVLNLAQKRCYAAARRSEALTEPLPLRKPSAAPPLSPQNVQVGKLLLSLVS